MLKKTLPKKTEEGSVLPSDFCLLGDSLYHTQRKRPTVRSFGGVIPTAFKSGKLFTQEFNPVYHIDSNVRKINREENAQHIHSMKGNYSRSTASDNTWKQDSIRPNVMQQEGKHDKQFMELFSRIKALLQKYKTNEQELIKENKRLKEEISVLRGKLFT